MCLSLVYLPPCVQKCCVTGDGAQFVYTGKTNHFLVQLRDIRGVSISNQEVAIKVDVKRVTNGDIISCQLAKEQDGQYKVTYQPTSVGEYKVSIIVNNELLPGSPSLYKCFLHTVKLLVGSEMLNGRSLVHCGG